MTKPRLHVSDFKTCRLSNRFPISRLGDPDLISEKMS